MNKGVVVADEEVEEVDPPNPDLSSLIVLLSVDDDVMEEEELVVCFVRSLLNTS